MTSRTDAAETRSDADPAEIAIADRVVAIADRSADRDEFLRLIASDAAQHFGGALVAITADHWQAPMWLIADDLMAAQLQRESVTSLLTAADACPIACSVPLRHPTSDGSHSSRAIRVEMTQTPERTAILIVYPSAKRIDSLTQLYDLKSLRVYREATRRVIAQVPIHAGERLPVTGSATQAVLGRGSGDASVLSADRHRLRSFHHDLDLVATAFRIANQSRRLIDCDRVTVLVPDARTLGQRQRYRVVAVSGVAVVDRRSNAVRSTESMVNAAVVMSRPLTLPSVQPLPPQIEGPIDDYLDLNGVGTAAILPLHTPVSAAKQRDHDWSGDETASPVEGDGSPIGVMVLEQFDAATNWQVAGDEVNLPAAPNQADQLHNASRMLSPTTVAVAGEAAIAIGNSLDHSRVFGRRLVTPLGKLVHDSRRWWYLLAAAVMAGSIAAACVLETEHYVVASGTIEPTARREIFAAVDGVIMQVDVSDGDPVRVGDPLLRMENPDLQSQREVLAGKIATAQSQLSSIAAAQMGSSENGDSTTTMDVQQTQLESDLLDLGVQIALVDKRIESLIVRSPIDGIISTWQLKRRLQNRPVTRGNALLTIINPEQPWQLRLDIPTNDAGWIVEHFATSDLAMPASFAVATDVDLTHAALLQTLSTTARTNQESQSSIEAIADVVGGEAFGEFAAKHGEIVGKIDPIALDRIRPDVDVTAKVYCGRRSFAASWFDDVVRFYYRNIAFYLK